MGGQPWKNSAKAFRQQMYRQCHLIFFHPAYMPRRNYRYQNKTPCAPNRKNHPAGVAFPGSLRFCRFYYRCTGCTPAKAIRTISSTLFPNGRAFRGIRQRTGQARACVCLPVIVKGLRIIKKLINTYRRRYAHRHKEAKQADSPHSQKHLFRQPV